MDGIYPSPQRFRPLRAVFQRLRRAAPSRPLLAIAAAILACPAWLAGSAPARADRVVLPHLPADYGWWNGCSPTAAGMLFGYWEEEAGKLYDAFPGSHRDVPSSYPATSTNPADYQDARGVVAGWAHKQQGMAEGLSYGSYRDHPPDSLADFVRTWNGITNPLDQAHGLEMFAAWDDPRTEVIESRRFSAKRQRVVAGWSYADYQAEIDAGRPVLLNLSSTSGPAHSVLGVGYDDTGGKQDMLVLTTWRQGLRQWEWQNETQTGYSYSVATGTLVQPPSEPTPRLSAYLSITHPFIGDLLVELGVGDPESPQWSSTVWMGDGGSDDNLVLTDLDARSVLADLHSGGLDWYAKVMDLDAEAAGWIEDFQVRYGLDELVFQYGGPRTPIPDADPATGEPGVAVVSLQTPAVPARQLVWAGGAGRWADPNWVEGEQTRAPSGDEAMTIELGKVSVLNDYCANQAAAAVDISGGALEVAEDAGLEVSGSMTVARQGILNVEGALVAQSVYVQEEGVLAGRGAISGDVTLFGLLSPGVQETTACETETTGNWPSDFGGPANQIGLLLGVEPPGGRATSNVTAGGPCSVSDPALSWPSPVPEPAAAVLGVIAGMIWGAGWVFRCIPQLWRKGPHCPLLLSKTTVHYLAPRKCGETQKP